MASTEVSNSKPPPSRRLSPKGSFKLSLPGLLACGGQCKAATTVSPPDSPTATTGGARSARSLSSSASSSMGTTTTSRGRDRQAELREIFRHFDRDMDGRVSGLELREFFASIAQGDGGALELDAAAGDLTQMLGFEEFVGIVERKGGEEEEREDLRRAFEAFEAVKGSGRITPRGLQRVLGRLGDDTSIVECEAMIRAYDVDGDGELDFHDFHRMMSSHDD